MEEVSKKKKSRMGCRALLEESSWILDPPNLDARAISWYTSFVPIYEYECTECGHRLEVLQKLSDSPVTTCIQCEGKVERLVSSPAIQFKGTGWYITDYARKGQDHSEKPSKSSSSKDGSSMENRSKESGPAATASSTSKA